MGKPFADTSLTLLVCLSIPSSPSFLSGWRRTVSRSLRMASVRTNVTLLFARTTTWTVTMRDMYVLHFLSP